MKLNISYPATGCQKVFEIDDEQKIKHFYDKRMAQEVTADHLGDEWKGYVFRVCGGNDKQGFPMKQGILNHGRVRLLLSKGHSCYTPGRTGERKRKSVRGCIVNHNLSILNLAIVKKGEGEIEGLTDKQIPRRLGPKRANNIRKLFALDKSDPVTQYVIRRAVEKNGKTKSVAPKIQRLITPVTLQRKRRRMADKRSRAEQAQKAEAEYRKLLAQRAKDAKEKKKERRRSSLSKSANSVSSNWSRTESPTWLT